MKENKGKENLLRDSDQVIHSVILKGATMRIGEKEKKDREPFALLCKCNIASGAEGLPGCRLWETEEERS